MRLKARNWQLISGFFTFFCLFFFVFCFVCYYLCLVFHFFFFFLITSLSVPKADSEMQSVFLRSSCTPSPPGLEEAQGMAGEGLNPAFPDAVLGVCPRQLSKPEVLPWQWDRGCAEPPATLPSSALHRLLVPAESLPSEARQPLSPRNSSFNIPEEFGTCQSSW